jgi:hypothetical protein
MATRHLAPKHSSAAADERVLKSTVPARGRALQNRMKSELLQRPRSLFFPCGAHIGLKHRVRLPTRKSRLSTGDPGIAPVIQSIFLPESAKYALRSEHRECSQNGFIAWRSLRDGNSFTV